MGREAFSLLQAAAACVSASASEALDMGDVAAALTLVAKRVTALAGSGPLPHDASVAHVRATLAEITRGGYARGRFA